LVEETGLPGESHRPPANHWQTVSHNVVSSTPRLSGIKPAVAKSIITCCRNVRSLQY
jgi:hypothetical protein